MVSARLLRIAADLAAESPVSLDRLPHNEPFEPMYAKFVAAVGAGYSRHDFWWYMVDARKRGLLRASRRVRAKKNPDQ